MLGRRWEVLVLAAAGIVLLAVGAMAEVDIGDEIIGDEIGDTEQSAPREQPQAKVGPKSGDMMVLYIAVAFFLLVAAGVGKWASSQGHDKPDGAAAAGRRGAQDMAEAAGGGAARRNALARMRARRQAGGGSDSDDDDADAGDKKKLGAKKLAKLEAKEEKRAQREAMEEERAKRREKQEKEEEDARSRRQVRRIR